MGSLLNLTSHFITQMGIAALLFDAQDLRSCTCHTHAYMHVCVTSMYTFMLIHTYTHTHIRTRDHEGIR